MIPALDAFRPEFIIISNGVDAHQRDPFDYLHWSSEVYEQLTSDIKMLANKHSEGRIVSVLEGGYSLDVLEDVIPRHLKVLASTQ